MFVRQPQFRNSNADVQIFYGTGDVTLTKAKFTWNKPPGVSHVYMMLIGCGGNGGGLGTGGGTGAVTVWYGAAQNVPDSLDILASGLGKQTATRVVYITSSSTANILLEASSASDNSAGSAMTANAFTASGFFQSVAGVSGSSSTTTASSTTFLNPGGASTTATNYGYTNPFNRSGFFMLQPIIVGLGGSGDGRAGIGCGAGDTAASGGGAGMVLIASW